MGGFDEDVLNEEFGLKEKGLRSSVIVSLGYRSENDFNAKLPKSRLPDEVILHIYKNLVEFKRTVF